MPDYKEMYLKLFRARGEGGKYPDRGAAGMQGDVPFQNYITYNHIPSWNFLGI